MRYALSSRHFSLLTKWAFSMARHISSTLFSFSSNLGFCTSIGCYSIFEDAGSSSDMWWCYQSVAGFVAIKPDRHISARRLFLFMSGYLLSVFILFSFRLKKDKILVFSLQLFFSFFFAYFMCRTLLLQLYKRKRLKKKELRKDSAKKEFQGRELCLMFSCYGTRFLNLHFVTA